MGRFKELAMALDGELLAVWPKWFHRAIMVDAEIETGQLTEYEARRKRNAERPGKVAVMSLYGFIAHRAGIITDFFGGTAQDDFGRALDAFVSDSSITAIVFDVDSPGGYARGCCELAAKVREARDKKRIIAVASNMMASAAYYIGSAATQVVASPSAVVGCIGTLGMHVDYSKALEAEGVDVTVFGSSKFKAEGNQFEPLTDESRDQIQKQIDQLGDQFERDVATNRGVTPARVRASYGEGRAFIAAEAKQRGLVDRVGTLEDVLADLGVGATQAAPAHRYAGEADILRRRSAARARGWKVASTSGRYTWEGEAV